MGATALQVQGHPELGLHRSGTWPQSLTDTGCLRRLHLSMRVEPSAAATGITAEAVSRWATAASWPACPVPVILPSSAWLQVLAHMSLLCDRVPMHTHTEVPASAAGHRLQGLGRWLSGTGLLSHLLAGRCFLSAHRRRPCGPPVPARRPCVASHQASLSLPWHRVQLSSPCGNHLFHLFIVYCPRVPP